MFVREVQAMYKLPKGEHLYVRYSQEDSDIITHIICKKDFVEQNKMWILYAIDGDKLTKISQGDDPHELEKKIKYLNI